MEEIKLYEKTICLSPNNYEENCFQINFLDALSSLLHYIGENVFELSTKEDILKNIDLIKKLVDIVVLEENFLVIERKDNDLYYIILMGLKYRIEREIYSLKRDKFSINKILAYLLFFLLIHKFIIFFYLVFVILLKIFNEIIF